MDASDELSKILFEHAARQNMLANLAMIGTAIALALYAWGWWSGRWRP